MQAQRPEAARDQGTHRGGHIAFAGIWCADPVADGACLRHAAADIGERQAADQRIVVVAKDQKRISKITALVVGITLEAAAEGAARQIVGRPGRLPGREKGAAGFAQGRPFGVVSVLRHAQADARAGDRRHRFVETDGTKKRHDVAQAALRTRPSAMAAVLSSPLPGPSAAIAGLLRPISAWPAARALSIVTASTLATISLSGIGLP